MSLPKATHMLNLLAPGPATSVKNQNLKSRTAATLDPFRGLADKYFDDLRCSYRHRECYPIGRQPGVSRAAVVVQTEAAAWHAQVTQRNR